MSSTSSLQHNINEEDQMSGLKSNLRDVSADADGTMCPSHYLCQKCLLINELCSLAAAVFAAPPLFLALFFFFKSCHNISLVT